MRIRFRNATYAAVFLAAGWAFEGKDGAKTVDRSTLSSRTHRTWEGTYVFSEESVIEIEGRKDLHVLVYRCVDHEGMLIDFAEITAGGKVRLLREANSDQMGTTPILEGINVLVESNKAEIVVRWRDPGKGEQRLIEKYYYSEGTIPAGKLVILSYQREGKVLDQQRNRKQFNSCQILPAFAISTWYKRTGAINQWGHSIFWTIYL